MVDVELSCLHVSSNNTEYQDDQHWQLEESVNNNSSVDVATKQWEFSANESNSDLNSYGSVTATCRRMMKTIVIIIKTIPAGWNDGKIC